MWGLLKALRVEGRRVDSGDPACRRCCRPRSAREGREVVAGPAGPGGQLRRRRRRRRPPRRRRCEPALTEVARELSERGVPTEVRVAATRGRRGRRAAWVELRHRGRGPPVRLPGPGDESPVPTYGGRMIGDRDQYARLEVHLDGGGQDYDVMGYTDDAGHPRLPRPVRAAPGVPRHAAAPASCSSCATASRAIRSGSSKRCRATTRAAPDDPIRVTTDANGFYHFTGLPAGTYAVVASSARGRDRQRRSRPARSAASR